MKASAKELFRVNSDFKKEPKPVFHCHPVDSHCNIPVCIKLTSENEHDMLKKLFLLVSLLHNGLIYFPKQVLSVFFIYPFLKHHGKKIRSEKIITFTDYIFN